ncbi:MULTISPECIES: YjfB family protein [Bacillaceae]|uniref:YjfB family protein n=1 Tax=Bacillaceae TaxID=186817 RepID=UPI001E4E6B74|nr:MULTISPECIES: YjfB family protein [Bacillaceae]MCE4047991.1 YjfB family protein [Bacillus sp. Au-Bac7]MCM3032521.1 YjfB family protein [Niallia sp. MER 6]MDL0436428.1 YjfB family protein [Niallia sp. SS-2023]UPO89173.1 YjfB family protein [Niallia sp. Man26]
MDIPALSVSMHQASLSQSVSLALTKMSMDNTQQTATQMMEMLQAPHPTLGNSIDLKG